MEESPEMVVRVDRFGCETGCVDKILAHKKGLLHRALSVCIFDSGYRWLLQRRAASKYHSADRIANSCCSHPRPGEEVSAAAERRVREELGISCPLHLCSSFVYKVPVDGGMIEHEYDYLFVGFHDGSVHPNPQEVASAFFMDEKELATQLETSPDLFAPWFPFMFREAMLHKKKIASFRGWKEIN